MPSRSTDEKKVEAETIPLEEKEIKQYLDNRIRYWRSQKEKSRALLAAKGLSKSMCSCYVDAFQTVRVSLFGELLSS